MARYTYVYQFDNYEELKDFLDIFNKKSIRKTEVATLTIESKSSIFYSEWAVVVKCGWTKYLSLKRFYLDKTSNTYPIYRLVAVTASDGVEW